MSTERYCASVHAEQYVYFALKSGSMSAVEMADRLGMPADEMTVRGSRSANPAVPASHAWKIACHDPGLTVDEQIAIVIDQLTPLAAAIGKLAEDIDGTAVLQVVRYFRDGESVAGSTSLGWHLDSTMLDFLRLTGAELDIDEYDMTEPEPLPDHGGSGPIS